MNRRAFFGFFGALPLQRTSTVKTPHRYRWLTANEVSHLMNYPIIHRIGDYVFEYIELPNNRLRMSASSLTVYYVNADFTVGDLKSYFAARLEIENKIRPL